MTIKAKCGTLCFSAFTFRFHLHKWKVCRNSWWKLWGLPRQCLPHGLLSVAMHDGETDWMVLGVMLVSQSGISLVRPMPLRCPLGDITSILDGPGWARRASPLPGVHIIRWNACRSCQNILSLYQDNFVNSPECFKSEEAMVGLTVLTNTFSNFQ